LSYLIFLIFGYFFNSLSSHLIVTFGFAFIIFLGAGGFLFLAHWIPLFVLILLIGLKLSVAIIQAYVVTILTCIFIYNV